TATVSVPADIGPPMRSANCGVFDQNNSTFVPIGRSPPVIAYVKSTPPMLSFHCSDVGFSSGVTISVIGNDVPPAYSSLPLYTAVNVCPPAVRMLVWNLAIPVPSSVVPSGLRAADPSMNVTVPVGTVPADDGTTVAVKVTGCPTATGFGEAARLVAVGEL